MIFPPAEGLMGALPGGEPFIVPIAIPMIAGPSGMAAVMLMGSQEPDSLGAWSLALMIAWGATAVILMSATVLYKLLGTRALTAVERLMGMLLVAISVQMFLDGIGAYLGIASTARGQKHTINDLANIAQGAAEIHANARREVAILQ